MFSDRNFWDHRAKGFVDRDFGIIDELQFFDREKTSGAGRYSLLVWSDFVWRNFQSGHLKSLDWEFYVGLRSPVAKRLYRFLDKMFWRNQSTFVFDLKELAFRHVGISIDRENYDIIRELKKGITELEAKWPLLVPLKAEQRFRRVTHGKWQVEFSPRTPGKGRRQKKGTAKGDDLFDKLCSRGVNVEGAKKLLETQPAEKVTKQIEAFDFRMRNQKEGRAIKSPGGFLAAAIREEYEAPTGFESQAERQAKLELAKEGERKVTKRRREKEASLNAKEVAEERAVDAFLSTLASDEERAAFELAAVRASPFQSQYEEAKMERGERLERWRRMILRHAVRARLGGNICSEKAKC